MLVSISMSMRKNRALPCRSIRNNNPSLRLQLVAVLIINNAVLFRGRRGKLMISDDDDDDQLLHEIVVRMRTG
jgi:hypothetical protein